MAMSLFATNSPAPKTPGDTNFLDPQVLEDNPQVKQLMETLKQDGLTTDSLLDEHFLFASLLWGSVGAGYLLYGRKQRSMVPFVGGAAMIAVSFWISSWVWMSLVCVLLIVAVHQLIKRGY